MLLLERVSDSTKRECERRLERLYAGHAAKGRLQSGATVRQAVQIIEDMCHVFINETTEQVGPVAKSDEAFGLIISQFRQVFLVWKFEVDKAANLATGNKGRERFGSVFESAEKLLADLQIRAERDLEILRLEFICEQSAESSEPSLALEAAPAPNRGGKPLAAHWDAMWAEIAIRLWEGDLKPTKQKDISDAMFAWLSNEGIDAGQTAVTDRARTLWLRVEAKLRS